MTLASVSKLAKWIMILSLIPVLLGAFLVIRTHFSLLHAVAATGTITELIEERVNNNGNFEIYYRPVLSFKDTKGETRKTRSSSYFLPNQAKIGDKSDFLYNPEDFSTVEDLKFPGIFLAGFGLLHFLFFLVVMLITGKMLKSAVKTNIPQGNVIVVSTNAKSWNLLAKWMMAITGIVIIIGAALAVRTILFLQCAVPASGTIIELIEYKGGNDNGDSFYVPYLVFQDAKGETRKSRLRMTKIPPGKIGDKIEILYNPKNPDRAEENNYDSLWGLSIGWIRHGTIGLFIFWFVAIISKRRMNSAAKICQQ
ncbi:MAG: DUF3592 domain-containing protein [Victivallaceae bacterium]